MKLLLLFLTSFTVFGEFVEFSGELDPEKFPKNRIGCYEKQYYFYAALKEEKAVKASGSFILIHASIDPKGQEARFLGTFQVSKVLKVYHEDTSHINFKGKWVYKDSELMKVAKNHSYFIADEIPSFNPKFKVFPTKNINKDEVSSKIKKGDKKVEIASIRAGDKNYEIFITVPERKILTTIPGLPVLDNSYFVNLKGMNIVADSLNHNFEAYDLNGDAKIDLVFGYYSQYEHQYKVLLLSDKKGYKLGLFCEPSW